MTTELTTISTLGLATTDKKGNRVSFERSILMASKDERTKLALRVYHRQVESGVYGPIISDALAVGVLTKSQGEIVSTMLASAGRNPTKAIATAVCGVILAAWTTKVPKGNKAIYVAAIRDLAASLADTPAPTTAPVAPTAPVGEALV